MRFGVGDEVACLAGEHLEPAHGVDGVALAVMAMPLAPHCAEAFVSDAGGTAAMESARVRAEHEDLVGL